MALTFDSLSHSSSSLINSLPSAYFLTDKDILVTDCNTEAERLLQLPRKQILRRPLKELFHMGEDGQPLDFPKSATLAAMQQKLEGILVGVQRSDGSLAWGRVHTKEVSVRRDAGLVLSLTDVTPQRQVVDQLKGAVQATDDLLDSIPNAIFFSDAYGKIRKVNRTFENTCASNVGTSSAASIFDYIADGGMQVKIAEDFKRLANGSISEVRESLTFRGGEKGQFEGMFVANVVKNTGDLLLVGYIEDISNFLVRDEETMKASKFEALALLSGGVAHDLNNIMLAITANLELAGMDLANHESVGKFLNDAMLAARRAGELSKRLVTFAKGGNPIKEVIEITQQIISTVQFALRGSNLIPSFRIAPDLFPVEVDLSQFTQVLDNLVINAREACPNGGTLEVSANNREIQEDHNIKNLKPGWYVEILITDSGVGISDENLARIFDPYFSTKPNGSGIGLSTCYSILKRHSGLIFARSETSGGSEFTILLPSATPLASVQLADTLPPAKEADTKVSIQQMRGDGRRILMVDDEAMILNILKSMLKSLGYDPTSANRTEDGLILYKEAMEKGHPFSAVILDATIPGGIGGEAALRKFLEIDPAVRVVLCSGYTHNRAMQEYEKVGFKGKLEKPFQISELGNVLKKVVSAN